MSERSIKAQTDFVPHKLLMGTFRSVIRNTDPMNNGFKHIRQHKLLRTVRRGTISKVINTRRKAFANIFVNLFGYSVQKTSVATTYVVPMI